MSCCDGYYVRRHPGAVGPRARSEVLLDSLRSRLKTGQLDWYARQQTEQQLAVAESDLRRSTIVGSMFASGSMKPMAEHLADETDMPADDAVACLKLANLSSTPRTLTIAERMGALATECGALGILSDPRQTPSLSLNEMGPQIYENRKKGKAR